jgi:copper chaperone CopZ
MLTTVVGVFAALLAAAGAAVVVDRRSTDEGSREGSRDVQQVTACTLRVSGMTCSGCAAAVKMAANKVGGVLAVDVSHERGVAEVTFDPTKTNPAAIARAIAEGSGFEAEVVTQHDQSGPER